jgi:lauroyl/myristoyl acyltransferase
VARVRTAAARAGATPVEPRLLTFPTVALSLAALVIGGLPRVAVGEPLCGLAGLLWYLGAPAAREAVRDNLRHVLGREPSRRQIREVFRQGALNYWDTFALAHLSHAELVRLVPIRGLEHIDAARAAGKGAILAGAHLGSIALAGQIIPARGYPMISLAEPIKPDEVFEFFARQRSAHGGRMLAAGPAAIRQLLTALRNNEVVGLVTDRDVTDNGPFIEFFGAPTRFPDGAAALSVRTGAPILPSGAIRTGNGAFEAWIEPPITIPQAATTRESVLELTRAVARRLEYHIANHPEQWTVFQKRWPQVRPGQGGSEQ